MPDVEDDASPTDNARQVVPMGAVLWTHCYPVLRCRDATLNRMSPRGW